MPDTDRRPCDRAGDRLILKGRVVAPEGTQAISESIEGDVGEAALLGTQLAQRLSLLGASKLLERGT